MQMERDQTFLFRLLKHHRPLLVKGFVILATSDLDWSPRTASRRSNRRISRSTMPTRPVTTPVAASAKPNDYVPEHRSPRRGRRGAGAFNYYKDYVHTPATAAEPNARPSALRSANQTATAYPTPSGLPTTCGREGHVSSSSAGPLRRPTRTAVQRESAPYFSWPEQNVVELLLNFEAFPGMNDQAAVAEFFMTTRNPRRTEVHFVTSLHKTGSSSTRPKPRHGSHGCLLKPSSSFTDGRRFPGPRS